MMRIFQYPEMKFTFTLYLFNSRDKLNNRHLSSVPFPLVFWCVQVKVLFVRKLATPVTEELLEKTFSQFGKLERVKKLKDYAFVHFEERDAAVKVGCLSCI